MPKIERLSGAIPWIDLSFVERQRTPSWAIYTAIRCHLAGISLRDVSTYLDELDVLRNHVAVHNWVHKAELTPASTVSVLQLAVDEKTIRVNGYDFEVMRHGPRNSIERVFREVQRRTSSFSNSFSHVAPETVESWLETFAVYHNARQT